MTEPVYPDVAPFIEWMGATLLSVEAGRARLVLDPKPEFNNRRGVIHGGVLATLLDSAMARAARSLAAGLELNGTIALQVQFMQPASGALTVMGLVDSQSRSLAFCRGEVHDTSGVLVATATATMQATPRRRRAAALVASCRQRDSRGNVARCGGRSSKLWPDLQTSSLRLPPPV
ncbi:PaaI family thioesterase (plasmid) [Polaromonas sp. P1-6]|nr:PaaI family thioesterase [Polaromonas sp. P1-6]